MKKIKFSKQIPCNCSENCPERYIYENLLKFEMNSVDTFPCFNSTKVVTVSTLLDGYTRKGDRIIEYKEKYGNTYISYGEIKVSNDSIHIHDVSGSVNVNSQLDHTVQIVNNASALAATQKQELTDLFEQLKKALEPAENDSPEKTKRILRAANDVAEELSNKEPDNSYLKSATERLKETALAVKDIAPVVLPIATKIAAFVTGIF
jgi:internalin A